MPDFPRPARVIMERHIAAVGVDMDRWIDLFADDATLEFPYLESIGMGRALHGREAILGAITSFVSGVSDFKIIRATIYDAADASVAFAEYEVDATVKATGRPHHQFYIARMHVEGGKIVLMREYLDPVVVAKAFLPGGLKDLVPSQ